MWFKITSRETVVYFVLFSSSKYLNPIPNFVDKTVTVESFEPKDFSNSISVSSVADFEKIYKTKEELYDASQNVVYGMVKELSYFDESGAAHILYTFSTANVYNMCAAPLSSKYDSSFTIP